MHRQDATRRLAPSVSSTAGSRLATPFFLKAEKNEIFRNVSNDRVAWRVLCNAPTRYVVSPNKGFLFKQEKIAVRNASLNTP
ncbi:unnamed protein product [Heligmosomoides polygyrus]|uniref:MSP domain-containing protein n=1 Tax=Heligmosomoides polygyrus TaxID=6339 RepID=A0A183GAZ2_HELPZ|nr:unnamed protein product [Heligmosomoides polygyrus]